MNNLTKTDVITSLYAGSTVILKWNEKQGHAQQ